MKVLPLAVAALLSSAFTSTVFLLAAPWDSGQSTNIATKSEILAAVNGQEAVTDAEVGCRATLALINRSGGWELDAEYKSDKVWVISGSCAGRVDVLGFYDEGTRKLTTSAP